MIILNIYQFGWFEKFTRMIITILIFDEVTHIGPFDDTSPKSVASFYFLPKFIRPRPSGVVDDAKSRNMKVHFFKTYRNNSSVVSYRRNESSILFSDGFRPENPKQNDAFRNAASHLIRKQTE